jgi:aminomethyltransferase
MPIPTPFHPRTSALCESLLYKDWAGYFAVCSFASHHDPEYFALRQAAGLLDVSPLFKYEVTGPDAAAFLAYVSTRDLRRLSIGRVTYACFCDAQGKLIDDGTVARLEDQRYRVTTASPTFGWFDRHRRGFDVEVHDVSAAYAALALQGPTSRAVLEQVVGPNIADLPYFSVAAASIEITAGSPAPVEVEISRTGYTGDLGYELWLPASGALPVWDTLLAAGKPYGLQPVGLDALDVTRIEAGFVLQGVDYFSAPRCAIESRKSTPFEAGLGFAVALQRDPFIGQAALQAERDRGSVWQLVGLELSWPEIERLYGRFGLPPALSSHASRAAVPVYSGGQQVGQVTSSAWSPILKKYLALATVRADQGRLGNRLMVEHTVEYERDSVTATVVQRPFFDPERKRS